MSAERQASRALLVFACLIVGLVTAVIWSRPPGAGAAGSGELVAEPAFGAPTVSFLGASPAEAGGEVWAVAKGSITLARYTDAGGWETLAKPVGAGGQPVPGLELVSNAGGGRTTPGGSVVVAGGDEEGRRLVVRDPGGGARVAPDPGAALLPGELLFGSESGIPRPLLAAFDAAGGARRRVPRPRRRSAPRPGSRARLRRRCLVSRADLHRLHPRPGLRPAAALLRGAGHRRRRR